MSYDIRVARLKAARDMPYMTRAVMSTILVEKPGLGTMGTDCYMRVYYDPAMFEKWTLAETAGVLLHEQLHIYFRHAARRKVHIGEKPTGAQCTLWNIAADCSINQCLAKAKVSLPGDGCFPHKYGWPENLTTEQYYELAKKLPQTKVDQYSPQHDGSAGDGVQREWELGPGNPGKGEDGQEGDSKGPMGLGDYEQERLRRIVSQDISEHARRCGDVPGDLEREAKRILSPRWDPKRVLLAEVRHCVMCVKGLGNTTWLRPSRRTPHGGMRLPSNIMPVPRPLFIVDTSGSMSEDDLGLCLGVIRDVIRALPNPDGVRVITGDTRSQSCQKVCNPQSISLCGGGGTDMGAIMQDAVKTYRDCDCVVVVTDGYTPWPSHPLRQKCLALITQPRGSAPPAWIRTVYIHPDAE